VFHANRKKDVWKGRETYADLIPAAAQSGRKWPVFRLEVIMMEGTMLRYRKSLAVWLALVGAMWPASARGATATKTQAKPEPPQDTGFLNRKVESHGAIYKFQVYL